MTVCLFVAYTAVAVAVGMAIGEALARADAALDVELQPEPDLLADMPVDCLSDAEIARRCDRMEKWL